MRDVLRPYRRRTPELESNWERHLNGQIVQIDPTELSALIAHFPERIMIFDLRDSRELKRFPYVIPDALLTANVNLFASISWIPSETIIVLYAEGEIRRDDPLLDLITSQTSVFVLRGGLQSWLEARLPAAQISQRDLPFVQNTSAYVA